MVLEGYEDEYLDDEEGGAGHMDFSAEQAISQGGLSPKDKPGASSRVRQTGRQAGRETEGHATRTVRVATSSATRVGGEPCRGSCMAVMLLLLQVVVFRSKYTAWYQVPIVLEDVTKVGRHSHPPTPTLPACSTLLTASSSSADLRIV